jgi:hypothetical protein
MRYTLSLLAAVVSVSVAACGSSNSGAPAASGSSSSPAAASASPQPKKHAKDHVAGLISSVSGNTIQLAQQNGSATVDFANSTKISSLVPAQLSDVTTGSCVAVRPTRGSDAKTGAVTAAAVQIVPASNGQCPQPRGGRQLAGAIGSVNGNTLALTTAGTAAQTSVSVTNDTRYAKRVAANAQAISQGECLTANGTKDTAGALQAASITVRPAMNGSCPGARK